MSFLPEVIQISIESESSCESVKQSGTQLSRKRSAKSKTLRMGEGVEKLYENNSILWSLSILYKSILKESSYIERLHLTQRQSQSRYNKSITRYLNNRLFNSITI